MSGSNGPQEAFPLLIGDHPLIQKITQLIRKVAVTDATILIMGESGTGKELVARAVHTLSSRADRPFIPVNCGAIPAELLESEMFGTSVGPSPAPWAPARACSSSPTAAPSSSTRSGR